MPQVIKLDFRPGINRETTDYANTGGWYDGNLIRFKQGRPESMGGWQRYTASAVLGTFRSLFPWSILSGSRFYSTGTNLKYYIIRGNEPVDITPIRRTVTLGTDPFATGTAASTTVTVTDTGHGAVVNSFVTYSGTTGPIDGIPASEFNAEHQITSIIDADNYTIEVTTGASSGSTSGGGSSVDAAYQINAGLDTTATGNGWGTGSWGENGWGEGSSTFVETDTLRLWSEDNFGEDLLFNVRNGGIYYKDMSGSVSTRAVSLASLSSTGNIPTIARQVSVSDNDRHVLAFASNTIGTSTQDPLLVRWSDSEDAQQWTPDTTNSAGSLRLAGGSQFVSMVETTTEMVVFTDTTVHTLRYIGAPYTFGQTRVGTNVQLLGPKAVVSTGSMVFWIGNGVFQMYDGVVRDIPCTILSYVFDNLNTEQAEKIYAGVNREYSEVIWLMPFNGSEENNFYVVCNYENPADLQWYYGYFNDMGRTTWLDSWFEANPIAGATDGYIYSHDVGADANEGGSPELLQSSITSSVFELGNGESMMLVSRVLPDMGFALSSSGNPAVAYTFSKRNYPGSAFVTGPDPTITQTVSTPVAQYTDKADIRFRTRSTQFGVEATEVGTMWQLGTPRLYVAPDGQR